MNLLILYSDQHNARCLSCAGHPDVKTPNLDRLAREGVRFENAWTNNPVCTPSRMSFLSSLYPSTHGYYGLYGHEPAEPMTNLFERFARAGYRTGALGKLHTPRYWVERRCQFVYDEFVEYPKYLEGAGLYEENDSRAFVRGRDGEASPIPLERSCEMALAKQTARFMRHEGEPRDRTGERTPWVGWVCFSRPHQPWTPSEPFASMYDPDAIAMPPTAETETNPYVIEARQKHDETRCRKLTAAYLGLCSQVDHAVGAILDELERTGDLDDTIVVYTADHGDYAGEHGLNEKGHGISYRAIARVPLIVRMPGGARGGRVTEEIVEAVDVFPTLCELAGVEPPRTVQGRSFAGMVTGENTEPIREDALTENCFRKALATKRWRYVANIEGERDELYDVESDPWELNNRIDDPACKPVADRMLRRLLDRVVRARRHVTGIGGQWHDHPYDEDGRIDIERMGGPTRYW